MCIHWYNTLNFTFVPLRSGQGQPDQNSVSAVPGTQLIRIDAEDDDPESAALIANTVASVFIDENNRTPAGGTITIIESAIPPDGREGPSLMARALLGLLAGASLGLLIVLGRTYLDGTVWDPDDLKGSASRLPILGILREGDLVLAETPSSSPFLPPVKRTVSHPGCERPRQPSQGSRIRPGPAESCYRQRLHGGRQDEPDCPAGG